MKTKIFFACLAFCFAWQVSVQASENNTIVNDNSVWNILYIQTEDETGMHTKKQK